MKISMGLKKYIWQLIAFVLVGCGGADGDRDTPILIARKHQEVDYIPVSDYSYFTPAGTLAVSLLSLSPPVKTGQDLLGDIVASLQFSNAVVRFNRRGEIVWQLSNNYGRFISVFEDKIFLNGDNLSVSVHNKDGDYVGAIELSRDVNYVHATSDKIAFVYNEPDASVEVYSWSPASLQLGQILFQSNPASYARSALLVGDVLCIADTFGHKTFCQSIVNGEKILEVQSYYPNDVKIHRNYLYVVEEHLNRIKAINMMSGAQYISMAAPGVNSFNPNVNDPLSIYDGDCYVGDQIRQYASDFCSGKNTLYAPNGLDIKFGGILVADTDNARIIFANEDGVQTVLSGLNNPTKVSFIE